MGIRKQRRKVLRGVIVALAMAAIMLTGIVKIPKAEAGVVPVLQEYTITYNANGGGGAPSNQTKYQDQDLVLRTTKPWQEGYEFKGWSLTKDGAVAYQPGDTYKRNASATLYAVWERAKFTIKLNPVGGSLTTTTITKGYMESVTLPSPTKSNYKFLGWAEESGSTTVKYAPGDKYSANRSVELWAVWQWDPAKYNVSFDANGGTGAPSQATKVYGTTLTLPSTIPSYTGHYFLGWSESSSATTATYKAGGSYTENRNIKLYAVWKTKEYTVWLCNNTGDDQNPGNMKQCKKLHGVPLLLEDTGDQTDSVFIGYDKDRKATTPQYPKGSYYTEDKDVTLFAIYTKRTYTVTYNLNGGSGNFASQVKTHGVNLVLRTGSPAKTGYTFKGWATTATATTATYSAGGTYSGNADITLYAVWAIQTYTVSYNLNGGSPQIDSQKKTYNQALKLSSVTPTRSGYEFAGWSGGPNSTSVAYRPGDTYTLNQSIQLCAVWTRVYTITLCNNSGGSGSQNQGNTTVVYKRHGEAITLPATSEGSGQIFLGYSKSTDATTATYPKGVSYTEEGDVTLFAVFTLKTYKVTYNLNGGSGNFPTQEKTYGKTLTLATGSPSKTGHNFKGWGTAANATTATYSAGDAYSANADLALYAIWEAQTYSVSYNMNGGSPQIASQTKTYGQDLKLSTTTPTKTGYVFKGWSGGPNSTTVAFKAGDVYKLNQQIMLCAVWEPAIYSITFNINGGTGTLPSKISKAYGTEVQLPVPSISRYGYYFAGWAETKDATTAQYTSKTPLKISKNTVLYAVWTRRTWTLLFNTNGGNSGCVPPKIRKVPHGDEVVIGYAAMYRTGYYFAGWADTATAKTAKYNKDSKIVMTADKTLYAVWSIQKCTLSFDYNGGKGKLPTQISADYGKTVTVPTVKKESLTREGYYFMGWSTDPSSKAAQYKSGSTITLTKKNTVLYAFWQPMNWTVTFDLNGGTGTPPDNFTAATGIGHKVGASYYMKKEGHWFMGWALSKDATEAEYKATDYITVSKDTTLYAVWQLWDCSVIFDSNGGTDLKIATQKVPYGTEITIPKVTNYSSEDYYFLGWSRNKEHPGVVQKAQYVGGDTLVVKESSIILYAVLKHKHRWASVDVRGKCETLGTRKYQCQTCGTFKEETEFIHHLYSVSEAGDGYVRVRCAYCEKLYDEGNPIEFSQFIEFLHFNEENNWALFSVSEKERATSLWIRQYFGIDKETATWTIDNSKKWKGNNVLLMQVNTDLSFNGWMTFASSLTTLYTELEKDFGGVPEKLKEIKKGFAGIAWFTAINKTLQTGDLKPVLARGMKTMLTKVVPGAGSVLALVNLIKFFGSKVDVLINDAINCYYANLEQVLEAFDKPLLEGSLFGGRDLANVSQKEFLSKLKDVYEYIVLEEHTENMKKAKENVFVSMFIKYGCDPEIAGYLKQMQN
ncbi:MAG: InlB B-repeat-containing protein [Lachnospiraceae bacterium]|nr:InlB B-repeat-containing protein [Lachnospiraceae bacterium]